MSDFLGAPPIFDQVARRRKNRRLKTEGAIPAHDNCQTHDSNLLDDHEPCGCFGNHRSGGERAPHGGWQ
jgi:hypothetical protein